MEERNETNVSSPSESTGSSGASSIEGAESGAPSSDNPAGSTADIPASPAVSGEGFDTPESAEKLEYLRRRALAADPATRPSPSVPARSEATLAPFSDSPGNGVRATNPATLPDGPDGRPIGLHIVAERRGLSALDEFGRIEERLRTTPIPERQLVVLDMVHVARIDSTGVGRLILLRDIIGNDEGRLVLLQVQPEVQAILYLLGMTPVLPIYDSVDNLMADRPRTSPPDPNQLPDGSRVGDETLDGSDAAGDGGPSSDTSLDAENESAANGSAAKPRDTMRTTRALADLKGVVETALDSVRNQTGDVASLSQTVAGLNSAMQTLQGYIGEIAQRMGAFEGHLNKLTGYFNDKVRSDKASKAAFDKLHEELKFYRDDTLFRSQKPVYRDLVLLYDDMGRMIRDSESEDVRNQVGLLQEVLLEILYRRDIEKIEDAPTTFDKNVQRALKRISTDDPAQDRTIAEVVRDGFRWGSNMLREQEVIVRRYDEASAASAAEPSSSGSPAAASASMSADSASSAGPADPDAPSASTTSVRAPEPEPDPEPPADLPEDPSEGSPDELDLPPIPPDDHPVEPPPGSDDADSAPAQPPSASS